MFARPLDARAADLRAGARVPPSALAASNPYTPERVCGAGYKQVDRAELRSNGAAAATVYLLYNASNGFNCVVTLKRQAIGQKSAVGAYLEVQGSKRATDAGQYAYYAGPVRAAAPGRCVRWGGSYGSAKRDVPFGHCGGTPARSPRQLRLRRPRRAIRSRA